MSQIWGVLAKFINKKNSVISIYGNYINMEFEVVTNEVHSWTAETTSNPVEKGEPVSDHVQRKPDTLQMTGIVSNASIHGKLGGLIERMDLGLGTESMVQQAFDKLYKLMDEKRPVTVYTQYKYYPDMVLTSLNIPRTVESGDCIEFTATFTHVRCVSTLLVSAEDAGINAENSDSVETSRKSSPEKNRGKVPCEPASGETEKGADTTFNGSCGPEGCQGVDTGRSW
ncbi:hypothetical protein I2494_06555 [Budviciaceae bacterium BWR-B9]|uniref:Dit-like phage tail protein N-terminal domain-containing protein n=1 Tax=Limnobaculum allomyrinae TaxID=2791986 RepID=A0ABS1INR6_9GAMM|nr:MULTISPECIES: hypothetical protein [Limnobaculum]MBK5143381.1 hypothetical protein [Limnobaculum allomyrinae]MBV7691269.1 hypothetical protein [Limnobaculum sp. M2-1]